MVRACARMASSRLFEPTATLTPAGPDLLGYQLAQARLIEDLPRQPHPTAQGIEVFGVAQRFGVKPEAVRRIG